MSGLGKTPCSGSLLDALSTHISLAIVNSLQDKFFVVVKNLNWLGAAVNFI